MVTLDSQIEISYVFEHTLHGIIGFRVVADFVFTERAIKNQQMLKSAKLRLKREILQWGQTQDIQNLRYS